MRLLFFLLLCIAVGGCGHSPESTDQVELTALLRRTHDLECERNALRSELDLLWNTVSDSLETHLPDDMGPDERRNMIAIRNADLIRMFDVYPALDSSIHRLVDWAEDQDVRLAAKIRQLQDKQQAHDVAVQSFFSRLEESAPGEYQPWRDSLEAARQLPCPIINK